LPQFSVLRFQTCVFGLKVLDLLFADFDFRFDFCDFVAKV
jgi:hypothetical protein